MTGARSASIGRGWRSGLALVVVWVLAAAAMGAERFPRPEFESGYAPPVTHVPAARVSLPALDVALLAGALTLATWLALTRRSRRGLFWLGIGALLYFGFWRRGCICPVGSVQNVAAAFGDGGYAIPLAVLLFFLLPLAFAWWGGRTFCAAVCPLGAIQDLFVFRPVRVPRGVEAALGLLPHVYLGAAVLYAWAGAGFLVCRYDPFVGLFRLAGPAQMIALGLAVLLLGLFVARPYCRYLCPLSVPLRGLSVLARRHVAITPDECVQCRLCEDACPFGAIRRPERAGTEPRARGVRRLALLLLLVPAAAACGGWLGYRAHGLLAAGHPTVRLARDVREQAAGRAGSPSIDLETFAASGRTAASLERDAAHVRARFAAGATVLGVYLGLVAAGRLVVLALRRPHNDYRPDRALCLSCGRCFAYCPVGRTPGVGAEGRS